MPTHLEEVAKVLHQRLCVIDTILDRIPRHVLNRLAFLIGDDQPPLYVDAAIAGTIQATVPTYTGRIVVVGARRYVVADLDGAPAPSTMWANGPLTSSVTVETWARARLVEVAVETDPTFDTNADPHWDEMQSEDVLARGCVLTLKFDGGREPLRLPLDKYATEDRRQQLAALVPSLLEDVGAAARLMLSPR